MRRILKFLILGLSVFLFEAPKVQAGDSLHVYSHFPIRYSSVVGMVNLANDNFIIMSRHKDVGSSHAMIGLTWCSQSGDTIQTKLYVLNSNSSTLSNIIELSDHSIFVTGMTDDPIDNTLFTMQFDSLGGLLHTKLHIGVANNSFTNCIQETTGEIVMMATSMNMGGQLSSYKILPAGDSISFRSYSFPVSSGLVTLRILNDSTLFCLGNSDHANFIFGLKANGDSISYSSFLFPSMTREYFLDFIFDDQGKIVISGTTYDSLNANKEGVLALKLDQAGNLIWRRTFFSINPFWSGFAISQLNDSLIAINTYYNQIPLLNDHSPVLILKSNGDSVRTCSFQGNFYYEIAGRTSMICLPGNKIFITATIDSTLSNIYQNISFGEFDLSSWVDVEEAHEQDMQITVYPNPAADELYFRHEEIVEFQVKIFDALGRMVLFEQADATIDISFLNDGIYYIQFQNRAGKIVGSKKVLILRESRG